MSPNAKPSVCRNRWQNLSNRNATLKHFAQYEIDYRNLVCVLFLYGSQEHISSVQAIFMSGWDIIAAPVCHVLITTHLCHLRIGECQTTEPNLGAGFHVASLWGRMIIDRMTCMSYYALCWLRSLIEPLGLK